MSQMFIKSLFLERNAVSLFSWSLCGADQTQPVLTGRGAVEP